MVEPRVREQEVEALGVTIQRGRTLAFSARADAGD